MKAPLRKSGLALSLTTGRYVRDVCQAWALVGTKRAPDPEKSRTKLGPFCPARTPVYVDGYCRVPLAPDGPRLNNERAMRVPVHEVGEVSQGGG